MTKFSLIWAIITEITTQKIKRAQYNSIDYFVFLERSEIFDKKAKQILWGISEIVESNEWRICEESDGFGLKKTSQKEPDKLDWIHVDAQWSKKNNFAKYIFPIYVHFIRDIKGFW